jgi:GGDEF domain-containing protein
MATSAGLIPVSLSAGAAPLTSSTSLDQALGAADRAMYEAKGRGSGQVVLEGSAPDDNATA